jgi:hypothetical protein
LKSEQQILLDRPTPFRKRMRWETGPANYMKDLEEYVKKYVRDAQIE